MKIYLYATLLIALLTNCEEGETNPSLITGKINQEFTLTPNQTIQLTGAASEEKVTEENSLSVQLIEANDERCPEGAQCFMFGSANVVLKVSQGKSYSDSLSLCLGDCGRSGAPIYKNAVTEFIVGANRYRAILKSVESEGKNNSPKVVQRVILAVESE